MASATDLAFADQVARGGRARQGLMVSLNVFPRLGSFVALDTVPDAIVRQGGRWRVEPVVAWLTRYQGCRRARRVGTAAAQTQLYQACAMRNLLMWLSRVRRGLAPPPA